MLWCNLDAVGIDITNNQVVQGKTISKPDYVKE